MLVDKTKGVELMAKVTRITMANESDKEQKRVAVYCRVSSGSADQLNSLANQIKYYTQYVKKHKEWTLVDIFAGMAKGRGFTLEEEARPYLINVCGEMKRNKSFANARSVRKLLDHTVIVMATHFGTGKAIDSDAIREAYEASGLGWNAKPAIGFTA